MKRQVNTMSEKGEQHTNEKKKCVVPVVLDHFISISECNNNKSSSERPCLLKSDVLHISYN